MLALTNKKVIVQPIDSYRFIVAGNIEVLSLAKMESNLHIINPKNFILTKLMLDPKWAYTCWLISIFLYRPLELYHINISALFDFCVKIFIY